MSVQGIVGGTVDVLGRAETLFAAPADAAMDVGDTLGDAADAASAIRVSTDELGGAMAEAHRGMLEDVTQRIAAIGDGDSQLATALGRVAESHASAASEAADLHQAADDISSRLDLSSDLPAAEMAGLLALRAHLTDMQNLVAEQVRKASSDADLIREVGYQP